MDQYSTKTRLTTLISTQRNNIGIYNIGHLKFQQDHCLYYEFMHLLSFLNRFLFYKTLEKVKWIFLIFTI